MERPDNLLTIKKIGDEHDLALADICDYALDLEARLKEAEEALLGAKPCLEDWIATTGFGQINIRDQEALNMINIALKGLGKKEL